MCKQIIGWIYQNGIIMSALKDGVCGLRRSIPRERKIRLFLVGFVVSVMVMAVGCQSGDGGGQRTTSPAPRVTTEPQPAMPMEDTPPNPDGPYRPAVPDADKSSLLYQAQVDLLRVLICSEERIAMGNETVDSDYAWQRVSEHFTDMGFRVIDGSPCPGYDADKADLIRLGNQRDVDLFVLLRLDAIQKDKFGNYYLYESEGRGKVAQISDKEIITTKSAAAKGTRATRQTAAAESALVACAKELGPKLSDEILRKSGRGLLLRRVSVDDLKTAAQVDYVRVGLSKKPGIRSVVLQRWDEESERANFWVRLDASVKENLGAYLEQLDDIRIKVKRLDKDGVDSDR